MSALNVTALTTLLGAYCRDNKEEVYARIMLGLFDDVPWIKGNVAGHGILEDFDFMEEVTDEVPLPRMNITGIVKPGHTPGASQTFVPKANAINFTARLLKVRDWSVDLLIDPKVLEKTWLAMNKVKGSWAGKFTNAPAFGNIDPEQFMMMEIIKAAHRDIRMNALYKGVYNAAGTTPVDIVNGWLQLVDDEITGGALVPIVTGVIDATNVDQKLHDVYDGLGEEFKAGDTQMKVAPQLFDWYVRKTKPVIQLNAGTSGAPDQPAGQGEIYLYGTNCRLKREPGQAGSQRVICTPKGNMVFGMDSQEEYSNVDIEKFERVIKVMMDGKVGLQFREVGDGTASYKPLAVNDQD